MALRLSIVWGNWVIVPVVGSENLVIADSNKAKQTIDSSEDCGQQLHFLDSVILAVNVCIIE